VTGDGTVKLLDFGIARLLREDEGLEQLPAMQGGLRALTPDDASPEQLRGQPIGTTADLYAMGVVRYELLSGRRRGGGIAGSRRPGGDPGIQPMSPGNSQMRV